MGCVELAQPDHSCNRRTADRLPDDGFQMVMAARGDKIEQPEVEVRDEVEGCSWGETVLEGEAVKVGRSVWAWRYCRDKHKLKLQVRSLLVSADIPTPKELH